MDRFTVAGDDGLVAHVPASDAARKIGCTGCARRHEPDNAACWAAVPDTHKPPVLLATADQLFDFKTGAYLGRYKFTVVNTWPYSNVATGTLSVTR